MSNINTGGPAFPLHSEIRPKLDQEWCGMTLRDYFAAKAMQANIKVLSSASLPDWNGEVARLSYLMADAMLTAREA